MITPRMRRAPTTIPAAVAPAIGPRHGITEVSAVPVPAALLPPEPEGSVPLPPPPPPPLMPPAPPALCFKMYGFGAADRFPVTVLPVRAALALLACASKRCPRVRLRAGTNCVLLPLLLTLSPQTFSARTRRFNMQRGRQSLARHGLALRLRPFQGTLRSMVSPIRQVAWLSVAPKQPQPLPRSAPDLESCSTLPRFATGGAASPACALGASELQPRPRQGSLSPVQALHRKQIMQALAGSESRAKRVVSLEREDARTTVDDESLKARGIWIVATGSLSLRLRVAA